MSETLVLNDSCQKFMDMFNLKHPIIQAPMDGPATAPLATAVTNAGALGSLPLTWLSPEIAYQSVTAVKAKTQGAFFGNYVLNFPTSSLDKAIEAGIETIQFSWGIPNAELVVKLRAHGIRIGIQVIGQENAQQAMECAPDFLVCQGIEAGGHVQANKPLLLALDEVLKVADGTPVAASGGIASGKDIRAVIDAGAAAAVLGSRFVATTESVAHPEYKAQIVAAQGPEDTVLTVCLNKVWPNATHRILRTNSSFQMWEAAGRPPGPYYIGQPAGPRPGEHDIVMRYPNGSVLERYTGIVPIEGMAKCDVNALGTYAGFGVADINDIPNVAELVMRLAEELKGP
jgi:nitronate monooxygenase